MPRQQGGTGAVEEAGLDLNELERESWRLFNPRGTNDHDEPGGSLLETVGLLRRSVEDLRSSFDWS
ncbi:hypothetical protein N7490_006250 [Penicillium lividum]|nr:hypothetical protein N7490_006250 [Penicillium lividum]